jgi:hypothetical protein
MHQSEKLKVYCQVNMQGIPIWKTKSVSSWWTVRKKGASLQIQKQDSNWIIITHRKRSLKPINKNKTYIRKNKTTNQDARKEN